MHKELNMEQIPLVSIGLPTCGRADLLKQALYSLVAQDYPKIEIIISDNGSTDSTQTLCRDWVEKYSFINYYRLQTQVRATQNFATVLLRSSGDFFMWASDDDLWDPSFISTIMKRLLSDERLVLVAAEAQYMLIDNTKLPFFREGEAFYNEIFEPCIDRLLQIAKHNYGNLIYGIYRKKILLDQKSGTVFDSVTSLNEIPVFIQVAAKGAIKVIDKVLFYKTAPLHVYFQAAREYGFRPTLENEVKNSEKFDSDSDRKTMLLYRALIPARWLSDYAIYTYQNFKYHFAALVDIMRALKKISLAFHEKVVLIMVFFTTITKHFLKLNFIWKIEDIIKLIKNKRKSIKL